MIGGPSETSRTVLGRVQPERHLPGDEHVLDARMASRIFILYILAQIAGGFSGAILYGAVIRAQGHMHAAALRDPAQLTAFKEGALIPSVLAGMLFGGVAMVLVSTRYVRHQLWAPGPHSAAWTWGRRSELLQGLAIGAAVALVYHDKVKKLHRYLLVIYHRHGFFRFPLF